MNITKVVQWIQLGNVLSDAYNKNVTTDAYTVGGLAIGPLVMAVLTGVMFLNPALGLTATTIATAGALASGVASQLVPMIKHLNDKRKVAAKERIDGSDFVRKLSEDAAARLDKKPIDGPITDDSLASYWWDEKGTRRPAGNRPDNSTLGGLKAWDAVRVELADGRIWEKADQ